MNTIQCSYPDRDAVLVAYLYDDIEPAERLAFEAHLAACRLCDVEFASLRGVRETLGEWAPPEPARAFTDSLQSAVFSRQPPAGDDRPATTDAWWHHVPVWAQVAAAMLVLGVSASVANLDIRYDRAGLSVRTGWSKPAPAVTQTAAAPQTASPHADAAPWRADLAALQTQLRSEMRTTSAVPATGAMSDQEFGRRVRVLLDESEKRQTTELAFRVAEVMKEVSAQRQADLAKIDRSIGYVQTNTYGEQLKQRELMNYYISRASQKQ